MSTNSSITDLLQNLFESYDSSYHIFGLCVAHNLYIVIIIMNLQNEL